MRTENGEWIMQGKALDDAKRIRTYKALIKHIKKVGFLPLFANSVEGFSVEEMTSPLYWWSGDEKNDPWEWRLLISRSQEVAYGKFFDKKAGFISLDWLPYFANWRRDGYDFDALWDDQKAKRRMKLIMDFFPGEKPEKEAYYSFELKEKAGFGKGGEKNFDGILTELQMMTYLVDKDFGRKKNKKGQEYGWSIAMLATPESIWRPELVRSAYKENPEISGQRIFDQVKKMYPKATDEQIRKILK